MIMMMVMMVMLNLDASWSSSSILLHMLVKLVSSSEGCRERFASNFILGVKKQNVLTQCVDIEVLLAAVGMVLS